MVAIHLVLVIAQRGLNEVRCAEPIKVILNGALKALSVIAAVVGFDEQRIISGGKSICPAQDFQCARKCHGIVKNR